MGNRVFRIAFAGALSLCLLSTAFAQDKLGKPKTEPKYRYILSRIKPDGQNNWMNWEGNVNWDRKITRDELWLRRDGKTYLVTDKQTMDEFQKAFAPKMEFDKQRSKYMDGYYEAKANAKSYGKQGKGIDRQIQSAERRLEKADSEQDRAEIRDEIKRLQEEKKSLEQQANDWSKKLETESRKRDEFYEKREALRSAAYKITDRVAEEAISKGIAKETKFPG